MKTVAELKRIANSGTVEAKMVYNANYGGDLPERLKNWRKIIRANSTTIFFKIDGGESRLDIDSAKLIDFDEKSLTVYQGGLRELTNEEQQAMDEWKKIEESTPPYQDTFFKQKLFFEQRGMAYLRGCDFVNGKRYDHNSGKIYDKQVRGAVALRYELRTAAE